MVVLSTTATAKVTMHATADDHVAPVGLGHGHADLQLLMLFHWFSVLAKTIMPRVMTETLCRGAHRNCLSTIVPLLVMVSSPSPLSLALSSSVAFALEQPC